jgi:membrane protease YdiL (CAAX protease family)
MVNCAECGASMPADAGWCGQCYAAANAGSGIGRAGIPTTSFGDFAGSGAASSSGSGQGYAGQGYAGPGYAGPGYAGPGAPTLPAPTVGYSPPPPAAPPGYVAPAYVAPAYVAPAYTPPTYPQPRYARPADTGRMLDGRAITLVSVAIGVGALGFGLSWLLGRDGTIEPEVAVRYAIVITFGIYAVVGALLASQVTPSVRLRWTEGSPWPGIALGLACGGALAGLLLAASRAADGKVTPDPRMVLMMSEGDLPHILAAILIACVAAPLVEETLFRGLLLESMRPRGTSTALAVSGIAFAVWHLNPTAIIYYSLMGMALGWLYMKRGLVCSMSAHLAFNGGLTIAAIIVVLSPSITKSIDGLTVHIPSGWREVVSAEASSTAYVSNSLAFKGPSDAGIFVVSLPTPHAPSASSYEQRLVSADFAASNPDLTIDPDSVTEVPFDDGQLVEANITAEGHSGVVVMIPHDGTSYELVFISAGSAKARADFDKVLNSLQFQ